MSPDLMQVLATIVWNMQSMEKFVESTAVFQN